jgi:TonB family protein
MKIVCDACGAKYAIADEKVRGKVFKIRCKKCSNVIVVRGLSGEGEASDEQLSQQETRTFGYDEQEGAEPASSGEGVWHLVIDQDQIGPITDDEVRERFARGEIDRDTYAWREGFGDWMPLGAIDVFTDLGTGGGGSGRAAAASAASAEATSADPFAAAGGGDAGGDLFGGANSGDGLFGGNGAGSAADRRLRGERNENSVLFSLGNLAALASDAPKPAAPAPSGGGMGAAPAGRAQAGGSEGSGLIDIRSMAQSYLGGKDRAGAAPMGSFSAIEPVTFATQSPVLLPQTPVGGGGSNKTLIAAIIAGSAAVIVAVVVVLIVVLRPDPQTVADGPGPGPGTGTPAGETAPPDTATPPDTAKPDTTAAGAADTPPGGTNPGTTATPPSDTPPADIAGKKPEDTAGKTPRTPTSGRDRPDTGSKPRESDKPDKPADKPEDKPATPPSGGSGCMDEVGCLLADKPPACCSKYSGGGGGGRKPGGGGGDANLPEKLTRSDITTGINKVRSGVTACSSKGSGEVKVTVKVDGSGSVGDVSVKSAPNAALGSCVANAVKKAKFAKTQEGATFTYPFVF